MGAKTLFEGGSLNVLYTDRRDFYIAPNVVKELWPSITPFTTIVANQRTINPKDPLFKMFEHRNPWIKQGFINNASTAVISANDTESAAVPIDGVFGLAPNADGSYLGLECEVWATGGTTKKGIVLITSVPSTTSLKFKNLTSAAITLADNDVFIVVGHASGEGTTAPEAWADELAVVFNSSQIFKTSVEITGTLYEAALRGESNELARLRAQKAQEHKMRKEKAFLFGGSVLGTGMDGVHMTDTYRTDANGKPVRTTMGIVTAIEKYGVSDPAAENQNIFTIPSATYKYADFVDQMEKVFNYVPGATEKYALCGPGALSYWSKMDGSANLVGKSGWQVKISGDQKSDLGFNIRKLETPHGILNLVPAPGLRGFYSKKMLVVDESNLSHAIYRKPRFQANIKTEDAYDGIKDCYFSDEGIGINLIEAHQLFTIQ